MLRELECQNEELYQKSIKDSLTGLYNRNYFETFLSKKIKEALEYNIPLCIAMLDIDFFKKINDTYGHLIGDCVLKELSNMLKEEFKTNALVARYGGEEIVIVMPFTPKKIACDMLEKFRKKVQDKKFCKNRVKMTLSIGVSEFKGEDKKELIKKADDNLYKAKRKGRNRVEC